LGTPLASISLVFMCALCLKPPAFYFFPRPRMAEDSRPAPRRAVSSVRLGFSHVPHERASFRRTSPFSRFPIRTMPFGRRQLSHCPPRFLSPFPPPWVRLVLAFRQSAPVGWRPSCRMEVARCMPHLCTTCPFYQLLVSPSFTRRPADLLSHGALNQLNASQTDTEGKLSPRKGISPGWTLFTCRK